MTWWENAITWGLSLLVLGVTIWGVWVTKKSNKAVMRQNLEQELAQIDAEIKEIDAQQADAEARGHAATQNVYGVNVPNPYGGVSLMLEIKKHTLIERRGKVIAQLKQL